MRRQGEVGCGVKLPLVEFVLENVVHPFVGANTGSISPSAGSFQAFRGVALGQAKDTQASTVSLLRVPAGVESTPDKFGSLLADLSSPTQKSFWRPLAVELVLRRHMHAMGLKAPIGGRTGMGGYPFVLVEDLNCSFGRTDGHFLAGQGERDTVEVFVEVDVVVDVDASLFPHRKLVGRFRQRGKGRL